MIENAQSFKIRVKDTNNKKNLENKNKKNGAFHKAPFFSFQ